MTKANRNCPKTSYSFANGAIKNSRTICKLEALKYWLRTRERDDDYLRRSWAPLIASMGILREEVGEVVMNIAFKEVFGVELGSMENDRAVLEPVFRRYFVESDKLGKSSSNRAANFRWGWFADLQAWCIANKDEVEMKIQGIMNAFGERKGHDDLSGS